MKIMMMNTIQNLSGNMISAMIDKIGFGSIAAFVGLKASEQAGIIEIASNVDDSWSMPEWAMFFSIIGTVSFFAKNIFEMYLMWRKIDNIDEDKS